MWSTAGSTLNFGL
jgi:hypothetical protein